MGLVFDTPRLLNSSSYYSEMTPEVREFHYRTGITRGVWPNIIRTGPNDIARKGFSTYVHGGGIRSFSLRIALEENGEIHADVMNGSQAKGAEKKTQEIQKLIDGLMDFIAASLEYGYLSTDTAHCAPLQEDKE